MNFYFEELMLWSHSGMKRTLSFLPNKVNVITGWSNTGKSAILQIIDYCLFANRSKIPESIINENVSWYGINFRINDKHYTVCRTSLNKGKVTDGYFFSSQGKIPDIPLSNSDEHTIKSLLEVEFGIDRNVRVPFGGKFLSAGSKISLRYFLIFTTISDNIITSPGTFFDKQDEDRYRDALPRIFDLAVGIDNIENILAKEKKGELEAEIRKLERMQNRSSSKKDDFHDQRIEIIKRAKEFGSIEPDANVQDSIQLLKKTLSDNVSTSIVDHNSKQSESLKNQEYQFNRIIRNLKRLKSEYTSYKAILAEIEDSVKPIKFLYEKKTEIIKTSIYDEIVSALDVDFRSIKSDIKTKTPIDTNVADLIKSYEKQLGEVRSKLAELPHEISAFQSDKDKYLFLGELKAKLELYGEQTTPSKINIRPELLDLQKNLETLTVKDNTESRNVYIKLLEEIIQEYIKFAGSVLQNYEKYHPDFDYSKKILLLRKPLTDFIENVGSSSNHMFMHLFFFFGLHEAIQIKKASFVPSYLIIDQPSRPYWGDPSAPKKKIDHSDEVRIRKAFELMELFVCRIVNKLRGQFQLIVFEHVPPSTWDKLNYVHLVDEFTDGNALIPDSWIKE